MTVEAKKEALGFQTEARQLLDLMIHSLYSNSEIFLRELISNASDAADRLRFEGLQDDSLFEDDPELKIRVEYDKKRKTITVIDNGIGMSRQEAVDHLGTIARSGTKRFLESLTGDQSKDSQLIGQFGVGFYSSFIVAEKVEVVTRRAGLPREEGARWISDGKSEYTVETVARPRRGTKVTLHLRDEAKEFLDGYRLRGIINKYSDHISLPIVMLKEGEDEKGEETVNAATALWRRNKKDIKEEDYQEFYKTVSHDFEAPLCHVHSKVEGKLEYASLLFIPARAPFDLWDRQQRHGVKLYVKRVFIMDDAEQLLPPYLRFVKGVVDSDDLPLNISRELLQRNKTIDAIRSGCVKKVLDLLKRLASKEPEKYQTFWRTFGRVLKEGVVDAPDKRDELAKLFRFKSTREEGEEETVSLDDYVARMKEGQEAIYYVTADSYATAKNSPHLEIFREKGIEALLLTDPIDEWMVSHLTEYAEKPLQSVTKGELDVEALGGADSTVGAGSAEDKREAEGQEAGAGADEAAALKELTQRVKQALDERVKEVRVTRRLTDSPACLVADSHELGRHLEQILQATGQQVERAKPVLEINPRHPLVEKLKSEQNDERFSDWAGLIFDQALLSEGGQPEDPAGFVRRLNKLLFG